MTGKFSGKISYTSSDVIKNDDNVRYCVAGGWFSSCLYLEGHSFKYQARDRRSRQVLYLSSVPSCKFLNLRNNDKAFSLNVFAHLRIFLNQVSRYNNRDSGVSCPEREGRMLTTTLSQYCLLNDVFTASLFIEL